MPRKNIQIPPEVDAISNLVRSQRKAARLTQSGLARLAGVGKTVVFDVEKGKPSVRFDSLLKIFKILNIKTTFKGPIDIVVDPTMGSGESPNKIRH